MQQNYDQRVFYLDLLRVIATFAVILLHVSCWDFYSFSLSRNWYISLVYDSSVRWCVPIFVMISGALFLSPRKENSYTDILKKRIPRLLLAYFFWSVIYALFDFIKTDFDSFSISELAKQTISSHFHLWFLPMLMGVYILIPVLRKIASDLKLMRYSLVIWLIFVGISFWNFISVFKNGCQFGFLFNMNTVVGFSGYFLFGYYLSQHNITRKQKLWIYTFGIIGALTTIIGTLFFSILKGSANERFFDNLSINVVAMSAAIFVFFKSIAPICGHTIKKINDNIRKDLFGIYLIHVIWIDIVGTVSLRYCCSLIVTLPLITIIVFFFSLLTIKLIRLIPYLRKVVE